MSTTNTTHSTTSADVCLLRTATHSTTSADVCLLRTQPIRRLQQTCVYYEHNPFDDFSRRVSTTNTTHVCVYYEHNPFDDFSRRVSTTNTTHSTTSADVCLLRTQPIRRLQQTCVYYEHNPFDDFSRRVSTTNTTHSTTSADVCLLRTQPIRRLQQTCVYYEHNPFDDFSRRVSTTNTTHSTTSADVCLLRTQPIRRNKLCTQLEDFTSMSPTIPVCFFIDALAAEFAIDKLSLLRGCSLPKCNFVPLHRIPQEVKFCLFQIDIFCKDFTGSRFFFFPSLIWLSYLFVNSRTVLYLIFRNLLR